jgi:hypothetical protein
MTVGSPTYNVQPGGRGNPPGSTHRAGGVLDLALGPQTAFAVFAYWASDHRTLLVQVDRARLIPLPTLNCYQEASSTKPPLS